MEQDNMRYIHAWALKHTGMTYKEVGKVLGGVSASRANQLARRGSRLAAFWLRDDYNSGRVWFEAIGQLKKPVEDGAQTHWSAHAWM